MKKFLLGILVIILLTIAGSSYFVLDKMGEFNILTVVVLAPVFIVGVSILFVVIQDYKKIKLILPAQAEINNG